jgi:hypothetical protein
VVLVGLGEPLSAPAGAALGGRRAPRLRWRAGGVLIADAVPGGPGGSRRVTAA